LNRIGSVMAANRLMFNRNRYGPEARNSGWRPQNVAQ